MKSYFRSIVAVGLILIGMLTAITALTASAHDTDEDKLTGTTWQLVAFGAADAPSPVVEGSAITLEFGAENAVGGSAGCNSYGGTYTVDGDALIFSPLVSTMMACADEALMTQEAAYLTALQNAATYTLTDDQLIITTSDDQQLVYDSLPRLIPSAWELVAFVNNGEETPLVEGSRITAQFAASEDGTETTLSGSGGCNSYGGSFTMDGEMLNFDALIMTEMACLDDALMAQEMAYFAALGGEVTYQIEGDQLTLTNADGDGLIFARVMSLVGTEWQLAAYGARDAATQVNEEVAVTLVFTDETSLGGSGGCNSYSGSYTLEGDSITIERVRSTRMACEEAVMQVETAFFQALSTATRITVTEDTLTIEYGEGEQLTFTRSATTSTQSS